MNCDESTTTERRSVRYENHGHVWEEWGSTAQLDPCAAFQSPAGENQRGLWALKRSGVPSRVYAVNWSVRIDGGLDVDHLHSAWAVIVGRHPSLRSHIVEQEDGSLLVASAPAQARAVPVVDLVGLEPELRDEAMRGVELALADPQADAGASETLTTRVVLVKLAKKRFELLFSQSHLFTDGTSASVLSRELFSAYKALVEGAVPVFRATARYEDFVREESEYMTSELAEGDRQWWRERLKRLPREQPYALAASRPTPRHNGEQFCFLVSPTIAEAVRQRSGQQGYMARLLAAFVAVLSQRLRQQRVGVGITAPRRDDSRFLRTTGLFINDFFLLVDVDPDMRFEELVDRVLAELTSTSAHTRLPFREVSRMAAIDEAGARELVDVHFVMQSRAFYPKLRHGDLTWKTETRTPGASTPGTAKVALACFLSPGPEGLAGVLEYATAVFDGAEAESFVDHLRRALEVAGTESPATVRDITMMSDVEFERLVREPARRVACSVRVPPVYAAFEIWAEEYPQGVAVVDGHSTSSYAELNRWADAVAAALYEQGVRRDTAVGVSCNPSARMLAYVLGTMKAGGKYVPLDPKLPDARVSSILAQLDIGVVLTDGGAMNFPAARALCVERPEDGTLVPSSGAPRCEPSDSAYVLFTSGTTGRPKGIEVTHDNLGNFIAGMRELLGPSRNDVFCNVTSLSFDISTLELFLPLTVGASVVVADEATRRNGAALRSLLDTHQVSVFQATPMTYHTLIESQWTGGPDLTVLVGGEALHPHLRDALCERASRVLNCYGPTETSVWSTVWEADTGPISIGYPIRNNRVYVLNERLEPVSIGCPGELYIGGGGVALGYVGQPELTATRFLPDPWGGPGARMYKTGDLVCLRADGSLAFLERVDRQVKLRGHRIELGEVEGVIAAIESVGAVAVEVVGEGDQAEIVAFVEPDVAAKELDVTELRRALGSSLPSYMVPGSWVQVDEMPLTVSKKIDRKALLASMGRKLRGKPKYEATSELERSLAAAWKSVLGGRVFTAEDNFFGIGGHSLLAVRLVQQICSRMARRIDIQDIFENPRFGDQLEFLARASTVETVAVARGENTNALSFAARPPEEVAQLSFGQEQLWFIEQVEGKSAKYNIVQGWILTGDLDVDLLRQSVHELVEHHSVLATRYPTVGVAAAVEYLAVEELALTVCTTGGKGIEAAQEAMKLIAAQPMSQAEGPLFRAVLMPAGGQVHLLCLIVHHLISDAATQRVLAEDLASIYRARSLGEEPILVQSPIDYFDYAAWQRKELMGPAGLELEDYWRKVLEGAPPTSSIVERRAEKRAVSDHGGIVEVQLEDELVRALELRGAGEGATLHMSMLAGFTLAHAMWGSVSDVVVGTPVSGRSRPELSRLAGLLVNVLPMRFQFVPDWDARACLRFAREMVIGGLAHAALPLSRIVRQTGVRPSLHHDPLFQSVFQLTHAEDWALPDFGDRVRAAEGQPLVQTARYDLEAHFVRGSDGRVSGVLVYATALISHEDVRRFQTLFDRALHWLCGDEGKVVDLLLRPRSGGSRVR